MEQECFQRQLRLGRSSRCSVSKTGVRQWTSEMVKQGSANRKKKANRKGIERNFRESDRAFHMRWMQRRSFRRPFKTLPGRVFPIEPATSFFPLALRTL